MACLITIHSWEFADGHFNNSDNKLNLPETILYRLLTKGEPNSDLRLPSFCQEKLYKMLMLSKLQSSKFLIGLQKVNKLIMKWFTRFFPSTVFYLQKRNEASLSFFHTVAPGWSWLTVWRWRLLVRSELYHSGEVILMCDTMAIIMFSLVIKTGVIMALKCMITLIRRPQSHAEQEIAGCHSDARYPLSFTQL